MPDRWTQFVTDDGWVVDVNTTNEVIDHIDNLAGASNSWQARAKAAPVTEAVAAVVSAARRPGPPSGCRNTWAATSGCCSNPLGWNKFR